MQAKWYTRSIVLISAAGIVASTFGLHSPTLGFGIMLAANIAVVTRESLR